jgi:hypothetical protein
MPAKAKPGEALGGSAAEDGGGLVLPTEISARVRDLGIVAEWKEMSLEPVSSGHDEDAWRDPRGRREAEVVAPKLPLAIDDAMLQALDQMKRDMEREGGDLMIGGAKAMTAVMLAGFLSWFLRAGSLLSSLLSTMPLWTRFDPLPVLAMSEEERRRHGLLGAKDEEEDEDEVAALLDPEKKTESSRGRKGRSQ